jgi:protein O-GlcNAc transferase
MNVSAQQLYESAVAAWRLGHRAAAIASLERAVRTDPGNVLFAANLGAAYFEEGRWADAEATCRAAIDLNPQRAESWYGLGNALAGQSRWREAAEAYERGLGLNPDLPNGDAVAAQAWRLAGVPERAAMRYMRSITGVQGRDDPELLTATAQTLAQLGQMDEPLRLYERVAQLLPGSAPALNNLGISYQAYARYDDAVACYRQALAIDPLLQSCWTNLIVCLNYSPTYGPADVKAAAEAFDLHCARPLTTGEPHRNDREPERPLRVGYVSPDLRRHAVAYFLLPLLQNHTDAVHVVCYSNSSAEDDWTRALRDAADEWVPCAGMTDDALAQRIRDDRIDVLVDLAGHTEGNRLLVFARKPAPVQVTWLGYVLTTGLSAMDARLTYPAVDPPGEDKHYTEALVRLGGGMWGYRPLVGMPEPAPPPCIRKGVVTFGHLNRYSKISAPALEAWAGILRRVPSSRLVIGLPPGRARRETAAFFESRGVPASRIDAYDKMQHERFWAMHAEIDIALDPFPFNGGTTSYETLWLGVPIVTCTGEGGGFAPRFSSRMGKALLESVGLPQLVGGSPADYEDLAVGLAEDKPRLVELRATLRDRMRGSVLLDERLHAREVERAYRELWRQWCGRAPKSA